MKLQHCVVAVWFVCALGVRAQIPAAPSLEAVVQPLSSETVVAPEADLAKRSTDPLCSAAYVNTLIGAKIKDALSEERATQCNDARAFLLRACDAKDEVAKIKDAVVAACFDPPPPPLPPKSTSKSGSTSFSSVTSDSANTIAPSGPPVTTPSSPLQTAAGVGLTFEQKLIFGLTALAVSGVREALLEEALGDFGTALCGKNEPYFTSVCALINPSSTTLKTLSTKQLGRAFQNALQEDLERAVPLLLARAASRGGLDEKALTPISGALIDVLRGRAQGRALAQRVLLNATCTQTETSRCAALQFVTAAAASMFQSQCTDVNTCLQAFEHVVRDAAITRLESWAEKQGVSRECLSKLPADPASGWTCGGENLLEKLKTTKGDAQVAFWLNAVANSERRKAVITALKSAKPASPSIHGYVTLIDTGIGELVRLKAITDDQAAAIHNAIASVDPRVFRTADLAILVFRTAQGIRNHENPISLVGTAARSTPCEKEGANDLQCGFRLFGVTLASVVYVNQQRAQPADLDDPTVRARFLQDVVRDIRKRLADSENMGLETWTTTRLVSYYDTVDDFADNFLAPILEVSDAVQEVRKLRALPNADDAARSKASLRVVDSTVALFKAALASMPVESDRRARATRIVDDVGKAWTRIQQKNYALLLDSTVSLAREFNVTVPLGERFAEFQPLLEAFTSSQTQEEFNTKLAQFVDAAPSAIEIQEFENVGLLSMFAGGTLGAVWTPSDDADEDRSFTGHVAPYVPIGFEFAKRKKSKNGHAVKKALNGFMISIIDVGNLAAVEFSGGKQTAADATLKNVFSPGVIYRHAFTNKPYVWGAGVSLVPASSDSKDSRAPRFSFFVAYHLPLYRVFGGKSSATRSPGS
ncbi:MAG TPA: hypothetical protein VEK57_06920 [Thermoanaerobaculia bacterium]|nr:hypothetical protein [Thermoanaerobaculia bacterium]